MSLAAADKFVDTARSIDTKAITHVGKRLDGKPSYAGAFNSEKDSMLMKAIKYSIRKCHATARGVVGPASSACSMEV